MFLHRIIRVLYLGLFFLFALAVPLRATIVVTISPTSATMTTGSTKQFTATVTGTTNTAVKWYCGTGTITSTGLYTAPSTLVTNMLSVKVVSVADTTKFAESFVTLTLPVAISISISPTSVTMNAGTTKQFTATITGTTNTAKTWSCTSGSISTSGLYTAPSSPGTYTVKVTSAANTSKSASATVKVEFVTLSSLSPSSTTISAGTTKQFTAIVSGTTNTAVTWKCTGGTISTSGLYTAPSTVGTYTVTATSVADTTESASATVAVTQPVAISISPTSASINTGTTKQFTASVTNTTNTAVTWSATGGSVNSSGLYTAPSTAGTYTVKATSAANTSKSASATVTVNSLIGISISPTSASITTGATKQFTPYVIGTTNIAVGWSCTGGSVSSNGLYTAPSTAGTYTVKATSLADTTKTAFATVTVTPPIAISISPTSVSINTGATQQFSPTVSGTTNMAVTWSCTGGSVSSNGLYTAPSSAGTYTVKATSAADTTKTASATVTVKSVVGISISPTAVTINGGTTKQFTASVTGTSNTAVAWSCSVGSITSSGLYTAPSGPGTYSVEAASVADPTKYVYAYVTVNSVVVPKTFIVASQSTSLSNLHNSDMYLMASKLQGMGYTQANSDPSATTSDVINYLQSSATVYYHSGHGNNGVIITDNGQVGASSARVNAVNSIFSCCLTLTDTGWKSAMNSSAMNIMGYTMVCADTPIADNVADSFASNLSSGRSFPMSWYLANAANGQGDRWCSYSRVGSSIVEYSARTGNIPSSTKELTIANKWEPLGTSGRMWVASGVLSNAEQADEDSEVQLEAEPAEVFTYVAPGEFENFKRSTMTEDQAVAMATRWLAEQDRLPSDAMLEKVVEVSGRTSSKGQKTLMGYTVSFKRAAKGKKVCGNTMQDHIVVMVGSEGVVSVSSYWPEYTQVASPSRHYSYLLTAKEAAEKAIPQIVKILKSTTAELFFDEVKPVLGTRGRHGKDRKLVPAYELHSKDGTTFVIDAGTGNLLF